MQSISAVDNGRGVISVIDLLVRRRERVDIKPVRVQEIRQLLRPIHINVFTEAQILTDLEKTFNHLERCKALIWIFEGRHKSCTAVGADTYC